MRRQIVHGGQALDDLFMADMLDTLYEELERRLSGKLPAPTRSEGRSVTNMAISALGMGGYGAQPPPGAGLPSDGVCMHDVGPAHGSPSDEEHHAACMCQLAACPACLHAACRVRRAPSALLPFELKKTHVAYGWAGLFESEEQYRARPPESHTFTLPARDPDDPKAPSLRRPIIFPHPPMTDMLAVEEHLRWRLKELGAPDATAERRYGPSTNAAAAFEGLEHALRLDLEDTSDAGSLNGKMKVGRSKARFNKAVKAPPKTKVEKKKVYLPQEWLDEDVRACNTALVLTFRHFVRVSLASPFVNRIADRGSCCTRLHHPYRPSRTQGTRPTSSRSSPCTPSRSTGA
jgi:hypothetical protein